jgi:HEAT repeat protein
MIVGAAVLVLVIAVSLRMDSPSEAPPLPPRRVAVSRSPGARTDRVQDRLGQLRASYEQRRAIAPKPQSRVDDLPERAKEPRRLMAERDDELDAEDQQELDELRNTLLHDPDPDERIGAVLMLTGGEDEQTKALLLDAMYDEDPEVRLAVVEALGDFAEELSPDVLAPALDDSDAEVRFEAVGILGDMETPEAREMVRNSLNDSDEDVRTLAEGILDFASED